MNTRLNIKFNKIRKTNRNTLIQKIDVRCHPLWIAKMVGILLLGGVMLSGCTIKKTQAAPLKSSFFAMDTVIHLSIFSQNHAKDILQKAEQRVQEMGKTLSAYNTESKLVVINQNAGIKPVKVDLDTYAIAKKAIEMSAKTSGLFDVSVFPLVKLWDVTGENAEVPEHEDILELLPRVGYEKITLNENEKSIYIEEGMEIDFGGIAKGYIGAQLAKFLKSEGVTAAMIDLGGDITTLGKKPSNETWKIGLAEPSIGKSTNRTIAVVDVGEMSVFTSGNYARFNKQLYEETGEILHHILDPKTGYPSKMGLVSATVVTKDAMEADALATALLNMTPEDAFSFLTAYPHAGGVLVDQEHKVWITPDLKNRVKVMENYEIKNG